MVVLGISDEIYFSHFLSPGFAKKLKLSLVGHETCPLNLQTLDSFLREVLTSLEFLMQLRSHYI